MKIVIRLQNMIYSPIKFILHFIILLTCLLLLSITIQVFHVKRINNLNLKLKGSNQMNNVSLQIIKKQENQSTKLMYPTCNFFNCFNVYQCGNTANKLLVYVHQDNRIPDFKDHLKNKYLTKEFYSILEAIVTSKYYTSNPAEACIFVPSANMLNPNKSAYIYKIANMTNLWKKDKNYLIFNLMLDYPSSSSNIIDKIFSQAMVASIGYTKPNYRKNFDISLPTFSTSLENFQVENIKYLRKWLVISTQLNVNPDIMKSLLEVKRKFPNGLQILNSCAHLNNTDQSYRCTDERSYKYPDILQVSIFCLILSGEKVGLSILLDALATNCIPVIIYDLTVMPFDEVIDWSRAAVFTPEADILNLIHRLKSYSSYRIEELQNHGTWLYQKYFKSIKIIAETTLDIIADRIFPHSAKSYYFWNDPWYLSLKPPSSIPLTRTRNEGFTAIILTYDRIDFLFVLIERLSKIPSLSKIIVIWNNEYKRPPRCMNLTMLELSRWPKSYKLIRIVETEKNTLSNRFYPFDEIETEAVLSIDDDIVMLTEDEIEFAYEVWREFPDRIVGFPPRTHAWDNNTICWKYESEWINHVSMVLTGAAFYHKYWNYAYSANLPNDVRAWINSHMNCEDIAMNFLVSNLTRKSPIKVTAKKKFRCPECANTEMLSADLTHMMERTHCINKFTKSFGQMPLISVEFRADPVLFKDDIPDKLKRFNRIGSL